jgi:hypothetical protein
MKRSTSLLIVYSFASEKNFYRGKIKNPGIDSRPALFITVRAGQTHPRDTPRDATTPQSLTKELNMKKIALLTISMAALVSVGLSSTAFAQEKTRAEVRQELIQAEQNGSQFVSDTSYPDVSPIFQQQVAQMKAAQSSEGAGMAGTHAAGTRMPASTGAMDPSSCVGPVSYCSVYFGS